MKEPVQSLLTAVAVRSKLHAFAEKRRRRAI